MATIRSTSCCGLGEIDSITYADSPKDTIIDVAKNHFDKDDEYAFYVFTDIEKQKDAKNLCKFILSNNLGKIHNSHAKRNPNTGNKLKVYIWAVAPRNFHTWYKKNQ